MRLQATLCTSFGSFMVASTWSLLALPAAWLLPFTLVFVPRQSTCLSAATRGSSYYSAPHTNAQQSTPGALLTLVLHNHGAHMCEPKLCHYAAGALRSTLLWSML